MKTTTHRDCWICGQTATHTFSRPGSNTLHACDTHTRIDRAEAEGRGWTVKPIRRTKPATPYAATSSGRSFVKAITSLHRVGPRTRRWRNDEDLFETMLADVRNTVNHPGMWSAERQKAIASGWTAVCAYRKHIDGGRARPETCLAVKDLSPYQFAQFLGRMIDAGISNMGEAEEWLATVEV